MMGIWPDSPRVRVLPLNLWLQHFAGHKFTLSLASIAMKVPFEYRAWNFRIINFQNIQQLTIVLTSHVHIVRTVIIVVIYHHKSHHHHTWHTVTHTHTCTHSLTNIYLDTDTSNNHSGHIHSTKSATIYCNTDSHNMISITVLLILKYHVTILVLF